MSLVSLTRSKVAFVEKMDTTTNELLYVSQAAH